MATKPEATVPDVCRVDAARLASSALLLASEDGWTLVDTALRPVLARCRY